MNDGPEDNGFEHMGQTVVGDPTWPLTVEAYANELDAVRRLVRDTLEGRVPLSVAGELLEHYAFALNTEAVDKVMEALAHSADVARTVIEVMAGSDDVTAQALAALKERGLVGADDKGGGDAHGGE